MEVYMSRAGKLLMTSLLIAAVFITGLLAFHGQADTSSFSQKQSTRQEQAQSTNISPIFNNRLLLPSSQRAGTGVWRDAGGTVNLQAAPGVPPQARVIRLDIAALKDLLSTAPNENSAKTGTPPALLPLPLPDGTLERFKIEESSVLAPDFAALFPQIQSYRGQGSDNPMLTMRCDISPNGFHALILTGDNPINLHPAGDIDPSIYVSYFGSEIQSTDVQCLVKEIHSINPGSLKMFAPQTSVGPSMRTYRIAIAADWEYCNQYGGGTTAGTVTSINTWLNGANAIYERELAIHFNLVNDTDVIYSTERGFTAATDPYDNSNVSTMLDQVRPDLRDNVGQANYDIGHVFGQVGFTGGSGIAFIGVVCSNTNFNSLGPIKGGGATLVGGTVGNSTALGVWVHELGHQSGANHSFNGTLGNCGGGNRNAGTAWESGSGQTIMSYAATCGSDNITSTPSMRFHSGSYTEITNYIGGTGATCATNSSTGNNAPTVNGGPDVTIPKNTPFTLTATGTDPDTGDVPNLTYAWDQVDSGGSLYPQNGTSGSYNDAADPATSTRPIFRPLSPSTSPSRTFPSLTYIRNNANDPPDTSGSFQTAEELPRIGRTLNFRVMIRDNRAGGGGVNEDLVLVTVSGTSGPFLVTAPNTAVTWTGGASQTVTWSVNNTNVAPVNCANVKITLSTDGGLTFPTTLVASTPNDGSESITVPSISSSSARIKVEAIGNVFFDMSDVNFTIAASCPTITVNPTTLATGTENSTYTQSVTATGGSSPYSFSLSAGTLPNGLTLSSSGSLSGTPTQGGNFNITIKATDTNQCFGTRAYTLTINCQTINLTPAALPAGSVGQNYNQSITATGGTPPISFSVTSGSLPGGLTFSSDGLLSGMPTAQGTFNFTVTATDSGSCSGSPGYSITINAPSAINLVSFNARSSDGGTTLAWNTGDEINNLGFNIYRDDGKERISVNRQLIAGSALTTGVGSRAGHSYSWRDLEKSCASCAQARYWLEDIDLNGISTWHGPFVASRNDSIQATRSQAATFQELSARNAIASTEVIEVTEANKVPKLEQIRQQATLAGRPAVKILIKHEGWYRVSRSELVAAGLDPNADVDRLQLFADGREVPLQISGSTNGLLDQSSFIEFYGVGADSPYSEVRTYWLIVGGSNGKRIGKQSSNGAPVLSASFLQTVVRRDRSIYFSSLKNGARENFFGAVITTQPVDQQLRLTHLADSSEPARCEISLQGVTRLPHRVSVEINNVNVGEITFNGQDQGVQVFQIANGILRDGDNIVRLSSQFGPADVSLVDRIQISYPRSYICDEDRLTLTIAGGQQITLGGFTGRDVRVFDVTSPDDVIELPGSVTSDKSGWFAVTVSSTNEGTRRLIALTETQAASASAVVANAPSKWLDPNHSADIVLITRKQFFDELDSLKKTRERQGYSVAMVDVDDIYDELNFGNKSPLAVKQFLSFATTSWRTPPKFVLLAGDASYDPKNYLGHGDTDLVPTALVDTNYMETASDEWFVDFDNDGVGELSVGRLPFRTEAEANSMVNKIVAYETAAVSREVLLIADENDEYDFEGASRRLIQLMPSTVTVSRIDRGRVPIEAARSVLLESLDRGQKIVNYFGHGSADSWHGSLLTSEDAASLTSVRPSVFVLMTCLNGYFHNPEAESLGESLMRGKGAAAVWASTGMTAPPVQETMSEAFYKTIFGAVGLKRNSLTLGEAVREAKRRIADSDVRRTWVLLGDPAMKLR
jgi:hypothetical protein